MENTYTTFVQKPQGKMPVADSGVNEDDIKMYFKSVECELDSTG
jgi:hypothetical protein